MRPRRAMRVKAKYRDVAVNPHGSYHFHTGGSLARRLDYDEAVVARMPHSAIEAFAGVGNPYSQGELGPGERVVVPVLAAAALIKYLRSHRSR
jgi:arsenite methyltransferase